MENLKDKALELAKANGSVSIPTLQNALHLSYDDAHRVMSALEADGDVRYVGGIEYAYVSKKKEDSAADPSSEQALRESLEKRRRELMSLFGVKDPDDDSDNDESDDDENDDDDPDFFDDADDDEEEEDDADDDDEDEEDEKDKHSRLSAMYDALKKASLDEPEDEDEYDDDEDPYDKASGFLTLESERFPKISREYIYKIAMDYDHKSKDKVREIPESEIEELARELSPALKRVGSGPSSQPSYQVLFSSDLYLPDGKEFAPSVTSNEMGEYFFHHQLVPSNQNNKLTVRRDFVFLLKRHGMFFGDGTLVKQFLRRSDGISAAMELYGALGEAKVFIDTIL